MRLITKTVTALVLSALFSKAGAIEPFVVEDIQVEGLQRVELGSFFTELPIRVGETLDDARAPGIIRAIHQTGNFDFVKLEKVGSTLKVTVVERPTLTSITFEGNRAIKEEELRAGMSNAGISEGEILNQFVLSRISQEIKSQYFANGRYNVSINTKLVNLSRNRVQLQLTIDEGDSASIKEINIVGNSVFSDEDLKGVMELSTGGMFSFITDDNKYSSVSLDKDIESIQSYYKDRGYLLFNNTSTQVALSDDKESVYITINIEEGEKFKVNEIKVLGDFTVKSEDLENYIPLKQGDTYSAAAMTFAEEQIETFLGFYGYAYAEVKTYPEVIPETNEVDLTVFVNPGNKFYINNINFYGSSETNDHVFRRESRLQEGEALSSTLVERTKVRLQRLPFVENVKVENRRIPGEEDKVDLDFTIEERGAAQISGSVGYNDLYGFVIQGNLSHNNFLGEGKNVGLGLSYNKAVQSINLSYSDPYFTIDNVGLGLSIGYRETDFGKINLFSGQSLDTASIGGNIFYGIGEYSSISYGLTLQENTLKAPGTFDQRVIDFFETFGEDVRRNSTLDFTTVAGNIGWQYSSLNRGLFPTKGVSHGIGLEVGTGLGDLEYYKANYSYKHYFPITEDWIVSLRSDLGYGDGLGDTERLPYFKNFYGGGSGSLRGFEPNTVGPRSIQRFPSTVTIPGVFPGSGLPGVLLPSDSDIIQIGNYSVGGNASANATLELIFPNPLAAENKNMRTSLFVDVGNVWDTKFNVNEFDGLEIVNSNRGTQFESIPDFSDSSTIRASAGVALQWWSPFGPLLFSVSRPLKKEDYDQTETFTFSIGQTF